MVIETKQRDDATQAPETRPPQEEEIRPNQFAPEGVGPLLQRDYVLVLEESRCAPEDAALLIRSDFPRFSPAALARFTRSGDLTRPLDRGDTMHILMVGLVQCAVRVIHQNKYSLTLGTLEDHPEAGRITFGAYPDEGGRLVLRIRSRSRLRHYLHWHNYALLGKYGQTWTWVTFLERLAEACGGRKRCDVITSTEKVVETPADRGVEHAPTFSAGLFR
jgi:hypothetical protein